MLLSGVQLLWDRMVWCGFVVIYLFHVFFSRCGGCIDRSLRPLSLAYDMGLTGSFCLYSVLSLGEKLTRCLLSWTIFWHGLSFPRLQLSVHFLLHFLFWYFSLVWPDYVSPSCCSALPLLMYSGILTLFVHALDSCGIIYYLIHSVDFSLYLYRVIHIFGSSS